MQWRKLPLGPPIFVRLVDEEEMVAVWRDAQPSPTAAKPELTEQGHARSRRLWRQMWRRSHR
jgi:hypothetical protein